MKIWQLQEAKARFSEVVRDAMQIGPQEVSVRGELAVVIISIAQFEKLMKPKQSLVDFLRNSPLLGVDLQLGRDNCANREDLDL